MTKPDNYKYAKRGMYKRRDESQSVGRSVVRHAWHRSHAAARPKSGRQAGAVTAEF